MLGRLTHRLAVRRARACVCAVAVAAMVVVSSLGASIGAREPRVVPLAVILRVLGHDSYQLVIQNPDPTRFVEHLEWDGPPGLTVVAVHATAGGSCTLDGVGGIICDRAMTKLVCRCRERDLVVSLTAHGLEPTSEHGHTLYHGVIGAFQLTVCWVKPRTCHMCLSDGLTGFSECGPSAV